MVDKLKGIFGGDSSDDDKTPAGDTETKARAETTSDNQLKGIFGGGNSTDSTAKASDGHDDFVKRYTTGNPNDGYSDEEAKQNFQNVMKTASPDQIQMALKKTVANLPESQRAELGQMIQDRQQGKNLVQIQKTGESSSSATTESTGGGLDDILGGLLGGSGGGGLGDILGGLLGGSSGGSSSGGSGGGLGDILGGLLGGSDSGSAKAQSGATAQPSTGGGGGAGDLLGSLLSGPQGKAIMGGIAAFAMQAMQGDKKN